MKKHCFKGKFGFVVLSISRDHPAACPTKRKEKMTIISHQSHHIEFQRNFGGGPGGPTF